VQRPAEDFLRAPAGVGVGGVERGDALVERGPDAVVAACSWTWSPWVIQFP
jgi:hypothetical protein